MKSVPSARQKLFTAILITAAHISNAQATLGSHENKPSAMSNTPTFEVASIRPAADTGLLGTWKLSFEADSFDCKSESLKELLAYAFNVHEDRIHGGPGWLGTKRFDIRARVAPEVMAQFKSATEEDRQRTQRAMVGILLQDRFQLTVQQALMETPAFVLEVSKNGPKLKASAPGTTPADGLKMLEDPAPEVAKIDLTRGEIKAQNVPLQSLADQLSFELGQPVFDQTGISGTFDFDLRWASDTDAALVAMSRGAIQPGSLTVNDGPDLNSALQNQLGLTLKHKRVPVNGLLVEHAALPSDN